MTCERIFITLLLLSPLIVKAQKDSVTIRDIPYISSVETDAYRQDRCKLDIYRPGSEGDYPTIVFFTGVPSKRVRNISRKSLKQAISLWWHPITG